MKSLLVFAIALLLGRVLPAQDTASNTISYTRLGVVGGLTAGGFIYGHAIQRNMWWKGEKADFHFEWKNDWSYARGADKLGHAFFPLLVTDTYADIFNWCGLSREHSLLYAGGLALSYQTYIEIRDGFSKEWGFSWGDFGADVIGAAWPYLRHKNAWLQDFGLKISYYPSQSFLDGSNAYIMDDYESTYHWLSWNFRAVLPGQMQRAIPPFINIALGHSVKQLHGQKPPEHELYLSLDWNLEKLCSGDGLIVSIVRFLNHYHLPAPAVRIVPGLCWYGLKF